MLQACSCSSALGSSHSPAQVKHIQPSCSQPPRPRSGIACLPASCLWPELTVATGSSRSSVVHTAQGYPSSEATMVWTDIHAVYHHLSSARLCDGSVAPGDGHCWWCPKRLQRASIGESKRCTLIKGFKGSAWRASRTSANDCADVHACEHARAKRASTRELEWERAALARFCALVAEHGVGSSVSAATAASTAATAAGAATAAAGCQPRRRSRARQPPHAMGRARLSRPQPLYRRHHRNCHHLDNSHGGQLPGRLSAS